MTTNARPNETQLAYHRRRAEELKGIRQPWESVWKPVADYIEPTRLRLDIKNEGAMSRKHIVDSTATAALRTLQSGMHSGITSPARPWFRLATYDPAIKEFQPVKEYLAQVERRMREIFQASNVYNAFHAGYGDLGQFGQSCGILVEDDIYGVRMLQLMHGRFWIARDVRGMVDTCYRMFRWTVARVVERFGYKNCSITVQNHFDNAQYDQMIDIWHAIEPRIERDTSKIDKRNKPFLSNYWEEGAKADKLLEESGFDENPIIAPAWELAGEDFYGMSPGQIALGDIKQLQLAQLRSMEAIDKMVRPPMTGPASMKNNPASLLPGAITYADADGGGRGFRPAMEVNLRIQELEGKIGTLQGRIERVFFADLFMMLSNLEGIQPRNTFELAERKEEKLLQLGPVLENIYGGQLAPVIERTYAILNRLGWLPEPPREIAGQDLKIEYISVLAQAQRAVATGGIERGVAFLGNLAAAKPDVLDKFDGDKAIDVYFDAVGVDPSIVVPEDEVKKIRDARAQKQAQAESAAMMAQMAPAAKAGAEAASLLADAGQGPGGSALLEKVGII